MSTSIRIQPVSHRRDRQRFVTLPWQLYRHDPHWVPPLRRERLDHLSVRRNPFFRHAEAAFFIAERDGRAVGRISAQIDHLHQQYHGRGCGFFGLLEAEDDPAVFQALLDQAESWLRQRGMHEALGPFNLSINDECGLLVEGFDTPPSILMGHALPYYQHQLEAQDYRKAKDLLAFRLGPGFIDPDGMAAALSRARRRVRLRPIRWDDFAAELDLLRGIFEDAWSDNWHFVPFSAAEFQAMGRHFRQLLAPDLIHFAELDGEAIGMIVCLPDLNRVIADLNGRLLPLNWLRLLWRLKTGFPDAARVPLMGIRKAHQRSLLGAGTAFLLIDALHEPMRRRGVRQVELSWVLEDNEGLINILSHLGAEPYKRYRIYRKPLISAAAARP